jgi:hypothetical protein
VQLELITVLSEKRDRDPVTNHHFYPQSWCNANIRSSRLWR